MDLTRVSAVSKGRGASGGVARLWRETRRGWEILWGREIALPCPAGLAGQSVAEPPDIPPPVFKIRRVSGGVAHLLLVDTAGAGAALPCPAGLRRTPGGKVGRREGGTAGDFAVCL